MSNLIINKGMWDYEKAEKEYNKHRTALVKATKSFDAKVAAIDKRKSDLHSNIRKERDEHHMWMDNIKFRDSILKAQETIQEKFQEEQRLDKKLVKWRRRLVETVNQFITDVVDPALSSGLGHIFCRATCRPDLLENKLY